MNSKKQDWHFKVFRICLSIIFLTAGAGHLLNSSKVVGRLTHSVGWPLLSSFFNPTFLIMATGVVLLIGGLGLFFNIKVKLSSALLFMTVIPITLTVQLSMQTLGPLAKNIVILGSLLFIYFETDQRIKVDQNELQKDIV